MRRDDDECAMTSAGGVRAGVRIAGEDDEDSGRG